MEGLMIFCVFIAVFLFILGLLAILYLAFVHGEEKIPIPKRSKEQTASMLVVLGSGGHTTEILTLVKHLGGHYKPRYYVMADTDKMSEEKVTKLESEKSDKREDYTIYKIPRSREVKQSWLSSVFSTLYAALFSFPLVFRLQPEIVLCNGPGTCIPVCFSAFLLKIYKSIKVVYVESICRVESLSLSGKILYRLSDEMLVQWPQLQKKYPRTKYIGRVV